MRGCARLVEGYAADGEGLRLKPRICWQAIFINGNHSGNGKPLKQLGLLSRHADIRRATRASSVIY